jgi:pyruvate dehydrogenase E2 component (dihydrolipoamide acetyltransferase)
VPKDVFMPALGMTQETGKLLEWLVEEGSFVKKGQPLMVVETDKAAVELEAPASGYLADISVQPGEEVPVGKIIAQIMDRSEREAHNQEKPAPAVRPVQSPSHGQQSGTSEKPASPVARRIAAAHGVDLSLIDCRGSAIQKEDVLAYLAGPGEKGSIERQIASPKARRLACEHNLELKDIPGSGPSGAVLAADILKAVSTAGIERATSAQTSQTGLTKPEHFSAPEMQTISDTASEEIPTSRMWQVMAQRLTQSWQTVPHFYLEVKANCSRLKAWRIGLMERSQEKITYTDLLVKLVAIALRRHPRLNASWIDGSIRTNSDINIGLAVAVDEGLLVPVIHNADSLGINELAARRKELISGAQANRLSLKDLTGGTFTLSNLGSHKVDAFSAIVNPPEAAILAVGRITDQVEALDGKPSIQPVLRMTLSCDHRVVDGARGAEFLDTLVELIENPLAALD